MDTVPFVIAVSGISGAGKTSVTRRAAELLGNAALLRFDDYRTVSVYPSDLIRWLEEGADLGLWKTPRLAADLRRLRAGEPIVLPEGRGVVEPAEFLVMEEPFGKARPEMAGLIDLAAHLDVPNDVLLARRLMRRLDEERDLFAEGLLDQIRRDLVRHLSGARELDVKGNAAAGQAADLVLDGTKTVDELASILVCEARRRR